MTRILNAIEHGDAKAAEELLPLVYEELSIRKRAWRGKHAFALAVKRVA